MTVLPKKYPRILMVKVFWVFFYRNGNLKKQHKANKTVIILILLNCHLISLLIQEKPANSYY